MTEPQRAKEQVKEGPKVCPSCRWETDLALSACWKCGTAFETKTGTKKAEPARSLLVPASLALIFVLLVAAFILARKLTPIVSGAPPVVKEERPAGGGPLKVRADPDLEKIYPEIGGPGAYRFLVTNAPRASESRESAALYFDGLIGSFLRSNDGAKLAAKKEFMLGDRHRAVEYKIAFPYPEGGTIRPFIHHAVAAVIDGKAYAVSADAPQAQSEDGAAMKEHLLNSIRAAQKTSPGRPSP